MAELQEEYWQKREDWGEAEIELNGKARQLFAKIHDAPEDYSHYAIRTELGLKLKHLRGMRDYVHVRLETPVPRIKLTFMQGKSMLALDQPVREREQEIGVVVDSRVTGTDYRAVGNCQAWFYPVDRILVLWEVTLYESNKQAFAPLENKLLRDAWQQFEKWLLARFPTTERIVTPGWEPAYSPEEWSEFLTKQGYQPFGDERGAERIIREVNDADLDD
jgi:hypothetical protein